MRIKQFIWIPTLLVGLGCLNAAIAGQSCSLSANTIKSNQLNSQSMAVLEQCYQENVCETLHSPPDTSPPDNCNMHLGDAYFDKLMQQVAPSTSDNTTSSSTTQTNQTVNTADAPEDDTQATTDDTNGDDSTNTENQQDNTTPEVSDSDNFGYFN